MRPFSGDGQIWHFLSMAYAGFGAALLSDMLKPLRRGRVMTVLADVASWLIAAAVCALALGASGATGIRTYAFLGAAWGALVYAKGIRRLIKLLPRAFRKWKEKQQARRNT